MKLDLSGKIALITGGSSGIGKMTGILLANAGAAVIINHENSQKDHARAVMEEISGAGGRAEVFEADVSEPEEIDRMFEYVDNTFGRLDVLVNNAGIVKDSLLLTMRLADWQKIHDVNLRSAFLCTRAAVELMMRNGSGKVINVSSVSAIRGSGRLTGYSSSKGGLLSFTIACAVELAKKNIQVNAVLPGIIVSALSKKAIKRAGDKILERIPAARFGEPVETAKLILFLASDCSDYITGQAISVDGGMSIT